MTDTVMHDAEDVTIGTLESDKLTFTVPTDSPVESERGKEYEREFSYRQVDNEDDARKVIETKKWSLIDIVNNKLKGAARSNAYQAALAPHKAQDVDPEKVFESTIRNMVKQGIPETMARELLKNTLTAVKS